MGTTHFRSLVRYADPKAGMPVGSVSRVAGLSPYVDFMSDNFVYFNDFMRTSDLDTTNDWTLSVVGTTPTAALSDDIAGGRLILTTSAGATDQANLQYTAAGGGGELFGPIHGGRTYFSTDIRLFDANGNANTVEQVQFFAGLAITDSTVLPGCTDYMGFFKDDASGLIQFVMGKNNASTIATQTVVSTGVTLTAADAGTTGNPYIVTTRLAFLNDPDTGNIFIFVNERHVATCTDLTYLPDDEELCVSFNLRNGEAVAKVAHFDHVLVTQPRY